VFLGPSSVTAAAAFLLFVPVAIAVLVVWRVRPSISVTILLLGGAMFLPERIALDLPALPVLGKGSLTTLSVFLGLLIRHRRSLASARPGRGLEALVLVMIAGSVGTLLTNRDVLRYGTTLIEGLPWYDLLTVPATTILVYGLPFFLGRCFIRDSRDLRIVMTILAAAGLLYSLFMVWEIRMSPQLHRWVYGYHPNQFAKAVRWGGYRPMVFMESGIAVAIFAATSLIACGTLARARLAVRFLIVTIPMRIAMV
jgi:hypothetical protein